MTPPPRSEFRICIVWCVSVCFDCAVVWHGHKPDQNNLRAFLPLILRKHVTGLLSGLLILCLPFPRCLGQFAASHLLSIKSNRDLQIKYFWDSLVPGSSSVYPQGLPEGTYSLSLGLSLSLGSIWPRCRDVVTQKHLLRWWKQDCADVLMSTLISLSSIETALRLHLHVCHRQLLPWLQQPRVLCTRLVCAAVM